ncbi:hydrogen peroxide-inducible genes activator [Thetidibacter halocola]|uniref:Hydrogen peroxide-inducible genes activator n=1 Tax=Thetidibacter halocola TaxID=2827239 RepID=A0A8J8B808_9RHOB|nr:hydrogen peroxide-inducible genes activator [Thetidibacter halocola]MBS0124264.1 hydrogen peroxide-inducible genes activator [Thetidibacter halocola]
MKEAPTIRQVTYFLLLAETGSFGQAAERAGISQPSLSLQISALEKTLGLRLFERGRHGAHLTPEGRALRERALEVAEALEGFSETATQLRSGMSGQLRLGSTPTIGPYLMPALVRRLHQRHPDARLVLSDGDPRTLSDRLMQGQLDAIITQLPVDVKGVTVTRLFREPLMLAMAHDHPLARKQAVSDADLAGQDVLTLSPRYALHAQITALAREAGATLRSDYEGTSLDALRQMVAMNMGLTFLPTLYVRSEIAAPRGDVAVRPFRRGSFTRSVGLVWRERAGRSVALARLAEVARETIRLDCAAHVVIEG